MISGVIPKDIGNLDKLEDLALGINYLRGTIPISIFNISTLTRLYLGTNSLSGMLQSYLGRVTPNLRILELEQNELTGEIPNSISNASKLSMLDLQVNKISGAIPCVLGNLTSLLEIDLHGNNLNGLIPTGINKLQSLQLLSLGNNRLKGSITDELCQIKSLNELNLANNMLSGVIPGCLGNTSLRKLNLSSNKLTSHIPLSLWSLKDINVIDLSSNALSGTIPLEISNLRAIILLNLSRNQISGNIPTTMGGLQTVINISLAHNKLSGPIPNSLSGMINVEFLDISQNSLSGVIPKSLESLIHLKYFNISYNLLYGEIPNGGAFQNFTAESFVMNKDLCGKPQLQVHPCRKLHKPRLAKMMIKYVLPIMLVVILVGSCIVFVKCRVVHASESTNRDFLTLDPPRISYYELLKGTNNFDESNLLGKGSFGSVYQAILPSGKMIALKVFNLELEEAFRSFDVECATLYNLRHRNLIKIISVCSNNDFKSLIMEFMPNGSLDRWLYSYNYCLDILQRLNIMIDVASALEYLHQGSSLPVVHCDVKPSNILLDEDMVAHLSDFGIARLLGNDQSEIYTKTLATFGYMAPGNDSITLLLIFLLSFAHSHIKHV